MTQKHLLGAIVLAAVATLGAHPGHAEPELQLYIEGGTYCGSGVSAATCYPGQSAFGYTDEGWSLSGTGGLKLWAVGLTQSAAGPSGTPQSLYDVRLVVSYVLPGAGSPGFLLGGTTASAGYSPITDGLPPSVAAVFEGDNTTIDTLAEVQMYLGPLDTNQVTGAGRGFQVFNLGDMSLPESPAFNVATDLTGTGVVGGYTPDAKKKAQINAYNVSFSPEATDGYVVRFDLWACPIDAGTGACPTTGNDKGGFAPFSKNAQWLGTDSSDVPEPLTAALLGSGLLAFASLRRRR